MPTYKAPMDDVKFLLHDVLHVEQLSALPGYEEATPELIDTILEEGAKFCEEVLQPLNQVGDQVGSTLDKGQVKTPPGFADAFRQFVKGGWPAMTCDPRYGGQGMPHMLGIIMEEFICSSNLAWGMFPGLTHGAYSALMSHGSDELKEKLLPKLVTGEWTGTMCLTEAHAGTDLGILTTRAVPAGDGAYHVTGT